MSARKWVYIATILTFVAYVYSEQESDSDSMQNDSETFAHLGNVRISRGRNGELSGDVVDDRDIITREERKRMKAERRRMKEERRQERWERRQTNRRQQKQEGHRVRLDDMAPDHHVSEVDERDHLSHRPQLHQVTNSGVPVTLSASSSSPGLSGGAPMMPQPIHNGVSSSLSSLHGGSSTSSNHLDTDATPAVVDMEWMKANLSSLWSVVRALLKQQGRSFMHRGGRGRHHHSGVVDLPNLSGAPCPIGEDACRSEGGEICGGHGTCSCGNCFCHPGYYGTFCQCNDHSCPVYDGMTCGGPSRGQCRCGGCVCRPGYAGESCDCPTDTQACISPESDVICSGRGTCECGRCRCSDGHKGMYCEDTVYAAGVCEKLKSCVMCRAWNRDLPSCAECQITVTEVDSLEPSMTTCVMVNSGCLLQFSYIPQTADAYTVLVPRDMACPQ